MFDLDELSRCGVRVKFPEAVAKSFKKDDPTVMCENAICARLGKLTDHMIAIRAGSMAEWTDGYPHSLAGLLGDAAPSQARPQDFAKDVKAWWRAKESPPYVIVGPLLDCSAQLGLKPGGCRLVVSMNLM